MGEQEFRAECDRVLRAIEDGLDVASPDADTERADAVLTVTFDDDSKVIVSGNTPVREIWVAARSGGFHFRHDGGRWVDTRSGDELFASLSRIVSAQSGQPVILPAPR